MSRLQEIANSINHHANMVNNGSREPSVLINLAILVAEEYIISRVADSRYIPTLQDTVGYIKTKLNSIINLITPYADIIESNINKLIANATELANRVQVNSNFGGLAGLSTTVASNTVSNAFTGFSLDDGLSAGIASAQKPVIANQEIKINTVKESNVGVLNGSVNVDKITTERVYTNKDSYVSDPDDPVRYIMDGYLLASGLVMSMNGVIQGDIVNKKSLARLENLDLKDNEPMSERDIVNLVVSKQARNTIRKVVNSRIKETRYTNSNNTGIYSVYSNALCNLVSKTFDMGARFPHLDKEVIDYIDQNIYNIQVAEYARIAEKLWSNVKELMSNYHVTINDNLCNIEHKGDFYIINSNDIYKDVSKMSYVGVKTLDDVSYPELFRSLNSYLEDEEVLPKYSIGKLIVAGDYGYINLVYIRILTRDKEFYNLVRF